ncbi:Uncharacterised protein [Staphylococcus aureus]|nr:Uncharacterised protein [Staphylococcus aureus]CPL76119.1 Uncharacterised protein [Staphylococcus aureus]SCU55103.1 Uncharacterised protein [Staphylococcus aureus]
MPAQNSIAAHVNVLNSGLSLALPSVTLPYLPNAIYITKQKIASPINKYIEPIESEMALLIPVMISSLAFGKAIIGITAKRSTATVPIKVVQSITFSFFNCAPPNY